MRCGRTPGGKLLRLVTALALLLQAACASQGISRSVPLGARPDLGPAVLAVAAGQPVHALEPATTSRVTGAAKGAGVTTLAAVGICAVALGLVSPAGRFAVGVVCVVYIVSSPVVGAVTGAVVARPAGETEAARRIIVSAVRAAAPGDVLRRRLAATAGLHPERAARVLPGEPSVTAGDWREAQAAAGFRSAVILDVTAIRLTGSGYDPPMSLQVTVRARRYSLPGGALLDEGSYRADSGPRKYSVWAANDAAALRTALDRMLGDIAEQVVDSLPAAPARRE